MKTSEIKRLNISSWKKAEFLAAKKSKNITLSLKIMLHMLSIASTALYLQGVIAISAKGVFINYDMKIGNMAVLMGISLILAIVGSAVLEFSTIEAGSRVGDLIREYMSAKKDYDLSHDANDSWRVRETLNKILFFLPLAILIIVLQVFTFSSGAVNTSKLVRPPLSVEGERLQNQKDIKFSTGRIDRARQTIVDIESGNFHVTKSDLGSYSQAEEKKRIDDLYAPQLEKAKTDLKNAEAKYKKYLEVEMAKASNFKDGKLLKSAKNLMLAKREEIVSPALSRLQDIKKSIEVAKANVKKNLTKQEYIDLILKRKKEIIATETANLQKYKQVQKQLEEKVANHKKMIDQNIKYNHFLIAGFLVVFFQILIEIWFKMEREAYLLIKDTNVRNNRRNMQKVESEELTIPEEPVPSETHNRIDEESRAIIDLKDKYPELFQMCVDNYIDGKSVPTIKEMIEKVSSKHTVNSFRKEANGLLYNVDTENGNKAEWASTFKVYSGSVHSSDTN